MGKPLRVLMVEDSEDDVLLTIRALKKGGYDPVYERVENAGAMRKALREKIWDVILCDYQMPQLNGLAAIALLKETGIDIPLIIVSGAIGEETAVECMRSGAHDYVIKGNLSRLVPAVERELREAESRSKRKQAEEALRENEAKLQAVFNSVGTGILIIDRDTQIIIEANKAAMEMAGLPKESIIGQICHSLVCPAEVGKCPVKDLGQIVDHSERKLIHAEGHLKDILKTVYPITINGRDCYLESFIDITERKQAEQKLHEEKNFINSLIQTAQAIVLVLDTTGHIVSFNSYMEEISGYRLEEVRGKEWFSTFLPERDRNRIRKLFLIAIANVQTSGNVNQIVTKDGREIDIEWYDKTLKDEQGNTKGLLAVGQDITERKQAEEALRRSEENFRKSLDDAPIGVRIVTVEGETIYANRVVLDIYGFDSIEELKNTPVEKRYTPESHADFLIRREKRRQGVDVPSEYTISIIRKDGEVRYLQVLRRRILWDGERQFQVLYNDITERKRAEETLRANRRQLTDIIEFLPDATLAINKEGRVIIWNKAIEKMTGVPAAEMIGKGDYAYTIPFYGEARQQLMDLIFEDHEEIAARYTHITREGDTFMAEVFCNALYGNKGAWIFAKASPLHDQSGNIIGAIESIRDITDRKQAEEVLRESEEMLNATQHLTKFGGWAWNVERQTMLWTDEVYRIHDFVPGEMVPGSAEHITRSLECYETKDRPVILAAFQRCVEEGQPYDFDFPFTTTKGRRLWIRTTAKPVLESGRVIRVIGNIMDITDRKQAEEELRTSRSQLRALAARQQQIREEMMIMIAREIHDDLGGGLTGLKMDLSWLLNKMDDTEASEERAAVIDKIHASNALIDQMIHSVRRISTNLRPSILDDLGLIAALEWQLSEFTSRTEIPHEFATTFEYVNMEEDAAVAVFRIFQEALTNVARHSEATKVAVFLGGGERSLFGDENLFLEIRDNGRGITEEEILSSESLGLLGMKERVLAFGGELSIHGNPDRGTSVILKIPQHKIPTPQV